MSLLGLRLTVRLTARNSCGVWMMRFMSATENAQTSSSQQQHAQTSSSLTSEEQTYEDDIRDKILEASLPYVNELGWSKDALSSGAKDVGYPGVTHGMFTRGGGDLIHYFQTTSNKKLVDFMKKETEEGLPKVPGQFVEKAVKVRLEMVIPYITKWPQAIAIMSLPPNVPKSLATVLTLVDDICYYAGDRSVDFNWYARRIALAGVYKATELYLIQDKSLAYKESWTFLNNRLMEVIKLHEAINKGDLSQLGPKDGITSAFTTARNILGLNWNR